MFFYFDLENYFIKYISSKFLYIFVYKDIGFLLIKNNNCFLNKLDIYNKIYCYIAENYNNNENIYI